MGTVGLVGYGAMGRAFAERMGRTTGVKPLVYDVDTRARAQASADGLETFDDVGELAAACEVIDVIVRTDSEVLEVTAGARGVVDHAASGTVVLLHSSILPETTQLVAKQLEPKGIRVADACASGTPEDIRADRLIFLLGAPDDLAAAVHDHLLSMAAQVLHMGPLGTGNVAKLMKNMINASERLVIWEMLQAGEAAGISYVDALEMLQAVGVTHVRVTQRWREIFDPSGANLLPWSGTNLYDKDVPLAAELARSHRLSLPVTEELAASAARLVEANRGRTWPPA